MWEWLKSLFGSPVPAGPPVRIRGFGPSETPISRDGVSAADGAWKIDCREPRTVRLYEVADPGVEKCVLTFRARLKTVDLEKGAYLEMWCRFPGRGEFFSKGIHQKATGTSDWASYETPFYLKQGQRPDLVKLNLVAEGKGAVWVREVELLQTPLA